MSIPAQTLATLPFRTAESFGDRPALRSKVEGVWQDISYAQNAETVEEIGAGLLALGVAPGDRVGLLSDNRVQWTQTAAGIHAIGAVLVPIYPSSAAEECQWVLGNSGAVAVFCENDAQLAKLESVLDDLPDIKHVITFVPSTTSRTSLSELCEQGQSRDLAEVRERAAAVDPDDLAEIIYTSGTTGRPKGCMLTHANLTATNQATRAVGLFADGDVAYLYLPLAHIFAQGVPLGMAEFGGVVAFVSGGADSIVADLGEVQPTYLPTVPRLLEKLHAAITAKIPADVLAAGVAAALAVREAEAAGEEVPESLRSAAAIVAPAFGAARAVTGGRIRVSISGAAPISPGVLMFFHAAGVPVYEGYGLSESGGIGTLNVPGALKFGSIGPATEGIDVVTAPDGELLMRGGNVFAGYWKNPDATAEALVDSWLQTGDLGSIDEDGIITITGRKKDIIITAGGKNLTPASMESALRQSPLISQAIMHGDRRPYPVALVTLDPEVALPWATAQGLPEDIAELAEHPAMRQAVQQAVDDANANYAQVAQIKKFAILPQDLSEEAGELTPTLKMKRAVVNDRYADVLDALYAPG